MSWPRRHVEPAPKRALSRPASQRDTNSLVLDQEFARTSGEMLLTATSPLVMAATSSQGIVRLGRVPELTAPIDDLDAGTMSLFSPRQQGPRGR